MPQAIARDITNCVQKGSFAVESVALSKLAATWRQAKEFFASVCHLSDAVALGREPDADDEEAYGLALRLYEDALQAVMDYQPRDLDELSLKATLLNEDEGEHESKLDALTADILRLSTAVASNVSIIAMKSEYDGLLERVNASDDEATNLRLMSESYRLDEQMRAAPCDCADAALVKLQLLGESFEKGERADDKALFEQLLAYHGGKRVEISPVRAAA